MSVNVRASFERFHERLFQILHARMKRAFFAQLFFFVKPVSGNVCAFLEWLNDELFGDLQARSTTLLRMRFCERQRARVSRAPRRCACCGTALVQYKMQHRSPQTTPAGPVGIAMLVSVLRRCHNSTSVSRRTLAGLVDSFWLYMCAQPVPSALCALDTPRGLKTGVQCERVPMFDPIRSHCIGVQIVIAVRRVALVSKPFRVPSQHMYSA